jgi:hypothetical protein
MTPPPKSAAERLAELEGRYFESRTSGARYRIVNGWPRLIFINKPSSFSLEQVIGHIDCGNWFECTADGTPVEGKG